MFEPIIHNLTEKDHAFAACQHYNRLISNAPRTKGKNLEQAIQAQRQWKISCLNALEVAQNYLKVN